MPEKAPTPEQFNTSDALVAWIRRSVYTLRIAGKVPAKVRIPVWGEAILASCSRERIGDMACQMTQNGVRSCITKFYDVPIEWDADKLEVTEQQPV